MSRHPRHDLDDALLTPVRFSLIAALADVTEIDFQTLRDLLETDDSALSKAIATLTRAGYLATRKGYVENRPRTWVQLTPTGRAAFAKHVVALQGIVAGRVAADHGV